MKLAAIGPFVVSARATPQGRFWEGRFSVRRFDEMITRPAHIVGEARTVRAYLTKEEATRAALSDARGFATRHIQSGRCFAQCVSICDMSGRSSKAAAHSENG
jgi:hypothetical protein